MSPANEEPTTIGLSDAAHGKLKRLRDDGYFAEMQDGYRFAVALALAYGVTPPEVGEKRQTIFNVGTLDPDRSLYYAITALTDVEDVPVYRIAERLAEWGVEEMDQQLEAGELNLQDTIRAASQLTEDE